MKRLINEKLYERYKSYLISIIVFFFVFILSGALSFVYGYELISIGTVGKIVSRVIPTCFDNFRLTFSFAVSCFFYDFIPVFLMFLFGITVYSPLIALLSVVYKSTLYGIVFKYLYIGAVDTRSFSFFLFFMLLSLVSVFLIIYTSSFTMSVAIRFFAVEKRDDKMLSGALFDSGTYKCNANPRFLVGYISIFALITATVFSADLIVSVLSFIFYKITI